ncbi:MAG: hypothetical protein ACREI3_10890, partial [Nitrospirales bacterium]
SGFLPGAAHVAYRSDLTTLRYILGRTYGNKVLPDREYCPWSAPALTALAVLGYFAWAAILLGGAYGLIRWGPPALKGGLKALFAGFLS